MATGPYRSPPRHPPSCDRHPGARATDRCPRCAARLCNDCLSFAGARLVCAGCARGVNVVRRLAFIARALALAATSFVLVLPGLTIDWSSRPYPPWKEIVLKDALRSCSSGNLDLLLSSLVMHGDDQEVITLAEAYASTCALSPVAEEMVSR
ncbi:MAG: hypothetical protein ABI193_06125, partial [Minicystis sp.]